jgi:hypothetical protein
MTFGDSGSGSDPFIGGVDHLFKVSIGQQFLWNITSHSSNGSSDFFHATVLDAKGTK